MQERIGSRRRGRGAAARTAARAALLALGALALSPAAPARAVEVAFETAEVADRPETVWAVLTDFDRWEQVFPSVTRLAVDRVDERHVRLHTRTRVVGRTVRYTLAASLDPVARRLDCALDPREPTDVRDLASSWRLYETADGGTRIELHVRSDAGVALPRVLERRVTEITTRRSVDALVSALGVRRVALAAD